jgi:hypothetical protein
VGSAVVVRNLPSWAASGNCKVTARAAFFRVEIDGRWYPLCTAAALRQVCADPNYCGGVVHTLVRDLSHAAAARARLAASGTCRNAKKGTAPER